MGYLINQGFADITGYGPNDVIGKTSLELNIWTIPKDRAALINGLRGYGEVKNLEAVLGKRMGQPHLV